MAEATIRPGGKHSETIVRAARALVDEKGAAFTTQELIKQAGVALQTFYRHFEGKDQLLVAVIQEMIADACVIFEQAAANVDNPLERLHIYIATALQGLRTPPGGVGPGFITAEHWRLQQEFPDEVEAATKPFAALVQRELEQAEAEGLASPGDAEQDAWLITRLVMAEYHHYAFHPENMDAERVAEDVWRFCLRAVGGEEPTRRRARRRRRQ
jgi:AcrR family transcriptional regulator